MSTQRRRPAVPARRYVKRRAPARPRRPTRITGRGDYSATKKSYQVAKRKQNYTPSLGRNIMEGGGELLGSAFGLGNLGRTAGKHLAHLFGFGDYQVKENIFLNGTLPEVHNVPTGGGTIVRFQEYLGDVFTSATIGGFRTQEFLINPANPNTFPWLSQLAANYEQYSFEGLVFEFRSTSADALNSTNTALGTVMMATQYDVADTSFASKSEMLNYEFSNSVKPSDSCLHMIECAPKQSTLSELYTNAGGTNPAGTDPRFYNLGRFTIATTGFQAASVNVGELHCTYQVRLLKPKLYDTLGFSNEYALFNLISASGTNTCGATQTLISSNEIVPVLTSTTITIPAVSTVRRYHITFMTTSAAGVATAFTIGLFTVTGGTFAQFAAAAPNAGVVCTIYSWSCVLETVPNTPTVLTPVFTFAQTVSGNLRIVGIPNNTV